MAEDGIMEDMVQTEMREDISMGGKNDQPFAFLLRLMQSNGKPLPTGGFIGRVLAQMLHEVVG